MSEIQILSSFDGDAKPISAAEIIERTGLPRSSVFRSIKALISAGFVHQEALSKRYTLGPRVLQLGIAARQQLSAEEFIAEPLLELLNRTGETITFSLVEIPSRICVYVLEAPSDLRHVAQVGARYPLHLGAAGKVILANLGEAVVDGVLKGQGLSKSRAGTLKRELITIRQDGFAVTTGERVAGTSSIAAPIFVGEFIYGSVAVAGPTDRVLKLVDKHRPFVLQVAQMLSQRLSVRQHSILPVATRRRRPARPRRRDSNQAVDRRS